MAGTFGGKNERERSLENTLKRESGQQIVELYISH